MNPGADRCVLLAFSKIAGAGVDIFLVCRTPRSDTEKKWFFFFANESLERPPPTAGGEFFLRYLPRAGHEQKGIISSILPALRQFFVLELRPVKSLASGK